MLRASSLLNIWVHTTIRFSPASPWLFARTVPRAVDSKQGAVLRAAFMSPCSCARDFEFMSNDQQILIFEERGRYFGILTVALVPRTAIATGLIRTYLW